MDSPALALSSFANGRRVVERFAADGNAVRVAFWAKPDGAQEERLYLVADIVEASGPTAAYAALRKSLDTLPDCPITIFDVNLLAPSQPLARDAVAAIAARPGRAAVRLQDVVLGSELFEWVVIYQPRDFEFGTPARMTLGEVADAVFRQLTLEPDFRRRARVVMRDGTAFTGTPFEIHRDRDGVAVAVRFSAEGEDLPRAVRLDEIASIA